MVLVKSLYMQRILFVQIIAINRSSLATFYSILLDYQSLYGHGKEDESGLSSCDLVSLHVPVRTRRGDWIKIRAGGCLTV